MKEKRKGDVKRLISLQKEIKRADEKRMQLNRKIEFLVNEREDLKDEILKDRSLELFLGHHFRLYCYNREELIKILDELNSLSEEDTKKLNALYPQMKDLYKGEPVDSMKQSIHELINQKSDILAEGHKIVAEVEASTNAETGTRLQIKDIYDLDEFFVKYKTRSEVKLGVNKKKKQNNGLNENNYAKNYNTEQNIIIKNTAQQGATNSQEKKQKANFNESYSMKQNNSYFSKPVEITKAKNSTFYHGVVGGAIHPKDAIVIKIQTTNELEQIKTDINSGKYKNKKIILEVDNSKILISC